MIKKIIIVGEGGQGVKLLAHALSSILAQINMNVTLTYTYDAAVRGGNVTANIIYSDKEIENPIIDNADILLMLSEVTGFSAKKMIIEKSIFKEGDEEKLFESEDVIPMPLITIASEEFGNKVFVNMVGLGQLLSQIGIEIKDIDFQSVLPEKFYEKNIEAIMYGYSWRV